MQCKAKQCKAMQSNVKGSKAMQNKVKQSNAKQSNTKQNNAMRSNAIRHARNQNMWHLLPYSKNKSKTYHMLRFLTRTAPTIWIGLAGIDIIHPTILGVALPRKYRFPLLEPWLWLQFQLWEELACFLLCFNYLFVYLFYCWCLCFCMFLLFVWHFRIALVREKYVFPY